MRKCEKCKEVIKHWDEIVMVNDAIAKDSIYHQDCVKTYPVEYAVFDGETYIGRTDDVDSEAYELLNVGEYKEE